MVETPTSNLPSVTSTPTGIATKLHHSTVKLKGSIRNTIRQGVVFSIVLLVISSSPFFASISPADVLAVDAAENNERMIDTIGYRAASPLVEEKSSLSNQDPTSSNVPISNSPSSSTPSTLSQDGSDFTAQAFPFALLLPTNNIVNTRATYDIGFRTQSLDNPNVGCVEMHFPAGTITSNSLIQAWINNEHLDPGAGQLRRPGGGLVLIYDLFNAVSLPAGSAVRFEIGFFNNPDTPTTDNVDIFIRPPISPNSYTDCQVGTPTATDSGNTNDYTIKQIGTGDIADGAVTTPKIADNAVTTPKIADSAVTTPKIANGAVTGPKIATNAISPGIIERTGLTESVPVLSERSEPASCLSGEIPVSGGFFVASGDEKFMLLTESVQALVPIPPGNSWRISMFNTDTVAPHSFTPRVICMQSQLP